MDVKRGEIIYLHDSAYKNIMGAGNLQYGSRPLLVVSNDVGNRFSNICIVAPLTRKKKKSLPTHYQIKNDGGESLVLCEQLFTVNQSEIYRIIGKVTDYEMKEIEKCLAVSIGISARG